jgi:hypothetical protein
MREKLAIKIESKLSISPHKYFTEHLPDVFRKTRREYNLNQESLELFNPVAQEWTGFNLQQTTHKIEKQNHHSRFSIETTT